MKKLGCLALTLLLAFTLCLPALAREGEAVVAVNEFEYTVQTIQTYYNSVIEDRISDGETLSKQDRQETLDTIIEGYIDLGVSEVMCVQLGLAPLSKERQEQLDQMVDELYDAYVQSYASQIAQGLRRHQGAGA